MIHIFRKKCSLKLINPGVRRPFIKIIKGSLLCYVFSRVEGGYQHCDWKLREGKLISHENWQPCFPNGTIRHTSGEMNSPPKKCVSRSNQEQREGGSAFNGATHLPQSRMTMTRSGRNLQRGGSQKQEKTDPRFRLPIVPERRWRNSFCRLCFSVPSRRGAVLGAGSVSACSLFSLPFPRAAIAPLRSNSKMYSASVLLDATQNEFRFHYWWWSTFKFHTCSGCTIFTSPPFLVVFLSPPRFPQRLDHRKGNWRLSTPLFNALFTVFRRGPRNENDGETFFHTPTNILFASPQAKRLH